MQDFSKARTEVEVFSERGTFIEKLLLAVLPFLILKRNSQKFSKNFVSIN